MSGKGSRSLAPDDVIRRLDAACRARDARRIFLAEGADGTPHAVSYLVWDDESAYELMGGSDPDVTTQRGDQSAQLGGNQIRRRGDAAL